jgi:uncharacterized membrane protein HdeD (DUF308 family)
LAEEKLMTPENDWRPLALLNWRASFVFGLVTLILGIIVAFRPTQSLNVIAVLLGIAMIVSGAYQVARAFDGRENERMWRGVSGVLFILAGLVLLRHLHLTVALIGLFIGFSWVIQGVAALMEAVASRGRRTSTGWSVLFGVISLIAGIVVISAPITSVNALTIFMGIWLIIMGLMEMLGAFVIRHEAGKLEADSAATGPVNVPGQRPGGTEPAETAPRVSATGENRENREGPAADSERP